MCIYICLYNCYYVNFYILMFQNQKPDVPCYEPLSINLRSYDFVLLESFAKYVHRIVTELGLESAA